MKQITVSVVVVAALIFAAPRLFAQSSGQHPQAAKSAQAQQKADFDLRFIDMTASHHEMGVKMNQLAAQKATNPDLKAMAAQMAQDVASEIEQIDQLRAQLYPNAPKRQPMSGMDMPGMGSMSAQGSSAANKGAGMQMGGMGMGGMQMGGMDKQTGGMSDKMGDMAKMMEDMKRLEKLTGPEFDRAFVQTMIQHHEMHAPMSERAITEATHDEVRDLAKTTLAAGKKATEDLQKFAGSGK